MSVTDDPSGNWLVHDGRVLATLEIASTRTTRRKGLLHREGIDGAMLLTPAKSVHTFGMRFAIDVVHLDKERRVVHLTTMKPNRLGRFAFCAGSVIEAEAGAARRWGIVIGDELEIR